MAIGDGLYEQLRGGVGNSAEMIRQQNMYYQNEMMKAKLYDDIRMAGVLNPFTKPDFVKEPENELLLLLEE